MTATEMIEKDSFSTETPTNELSKMLVEYNLTPNQAKVYLFLSKTEIKTASEIAKTLKIPRTETYHLLSTLQQKGVIFSVFGKPTKFKAVGIIEALKILINNEKNKIQELEAKSDTIIKLWNVIPKHGETDEDIQENKFQSLQGRNSILVKLEQLVKESKKNILVLGTQTDFRRFLYTEFSELLNTTKSELKILTDEPTNENHIFRNISENKIKKLDDKDREDFCFIIKDCNEVIFFINNTEVANMLAVWTDSKAFVTTLRSLFSLVWKKSHYLNETDAESILGAEITYEHRLREIEQEKIILNYLQEHFQILEKEGAIIN